MTLDSSGAPILAMATSAGLTLRSPIVAGPACGDNSNAIVKLSADGSSLAFATYLDGCGAPAIALASNGSIYSGAASSVLNLNLTKPALLVDGIANAFSGDPSAVAVGGLYTLIGTGFPPVPNVSLLSTQLKICPPKSKVSKCCSTASPPSFWKSPRPPSSSPRRKG